MADTQDIVRKFIRTLIGALVLGLIYLLVMWVIALCASAFHFIVPSFVAPIVLVIFILIFVLFLLKTWGWNFTF
jgi:cation transporter-like permease